MDVGSVILFCLNMASIFVYLFLKEDTLATGTVKWFNFKKGYGFIQPEDNTQDIFVHISALQKAGIYQLPDGQKVSYELAEYQEKVSAVNIQIL